MIGAGPIGAFGIGAGLQSIIPTPPQPDPTIYPQLNLYAIIGPAKINVKSTMRATGINLSSKLL